MPAGLFDWTLVVQSMLGSPLRFAPEGTKTLPLTCVNNLPNIVDMVTMFVVHSRVSVWSAKLESLVL